MNEKTARRHSLNNNSRITVADKRIGNFLSDDTADDSLGISATGACRLAEVGELTAFALSAFCAAVCGVDRDFEELLTLNGDGRLRYRITQHGIKL